MAGKMERRTIPAERAGIRVEERADGSAVIRGLAAVFYRGGSDQEFQLFPGLRERVMPGAFDRALARGDDARALFNHDPNLPLGRRSAGTLRLKATRDGLDFEIDAPPTSAGRDLVESIKRGDVQGSSFGFSVEQERFTEEDGVEIRELQSVRLFDVSPATFPAYEATEGTLGVRAEDAAVAIERRDAWRQSRSKEKPMGRCAMCSGEKRGEALAARLNSLIDAMVEGDDDLTRGELVERLAAAAGIESGTVNQILNGSINCPPADRLRGFARVLGVSVGSLFSAGERDGCDYSDDRAIDARRQSEARSSRAATIERDLAVERLD